MSKRKTTSQVISEERIKGRKAMFAKKKVEGVWVVGVSDMFENGRMIGGGKRKRRARDDGKGKIGVEKRQRMGGGQKIVRWF